VNGSGPALTIRPMVFDDLSQVLQIDRVSFPIPWPERSYRFELQENPASHLLVAELDQGPPGGVVGYIGLWLIVDEAHISTLAVDPKYRRMGIGQALLVAGLTAAARRGAELASLEVRASNAAALQLYRKFGFRRVGRRPRYYRDNGEDALLMIRRGLSSVESWMEGGHER
jgi:[ribosomal protein S18]-alanine N-acetyltransferase